MSNELKVSFYLKRESRLEKSSVGENTAYPIIGKIIIGNSIAQFSTKLKIEERLWHVKSGRASGKRHTAVNSTREINKLVSLYTAKFMGTNNKNRGGIMDSPKARFINSLAN